MIRTVRLAILSLLLFTSSIPLAWAEQQPAPPPASTAPDAAIEQPEGPDLADMLHLSTAQIQVLQGINARIGQRLTAEKTSFREDMLAVLTETQRARLKQLVELHQNEDSPSVDLNKELGLSADQMTRLKGVHTAHQARMDALWDEYIGMIKKVLTPEQSTALDNYLRSQATAP